MMYLRAFHAECGQNLVGGGDFNTKLSMLSIMMPKSHHRYIIDTEDVASSAAQPERLRVRFSNHSSWYHGDIALTYGSASVQENSMVGKRHGGVSDAHGLVVARITGTDNTSSDAKPAVKQRIVDSERKKRSTMLHLSVPHSLQPVLHLCRLD